jgi:glyoxylase I family protein
LLGLDPVSPRWDFVSEPRHCHATPNHPGPLPRSLRFYRDILGFEVVRQTPPGNSPDWAWLRHGQAEIMLNTMYETPNRPPQTEPARMAAHRDTAFYPGAPDVDAMYAYLRDQGIEAEAPVTQSYGMRQTYLRDPDGYTLCFQWPAD